MRKILSLLSILLVTCVSRGIPAATWYVDCSLLASGDGTSWQSAFKAIQEGIDVASQGDTVIVGKGTYVENILFWGRNIVLRSTAPTDPAVVASTIIDGDQAGSVVTFSGTEDETCMLSGFTIRNGEAEDGGAIWGGDGEKSAHATIEHNVISGNHSGRALAFCAGIIQHNVVCANSGGYALSHCPGLIQYNTIAGNSGGGLASCNGTIQYNTISGNSSIRGGGLIDCDGVIQNNTITRNSAGGFADSSGGGLAECDGTIQNNRISENWAEWSGGGLSACGGKILGNVIVGNRLYLTSPPDPDLGGRGGGLYGCNGVISNNTIIGNSATYEGAYCSCKGTITNCIVWENSSISLLEFCESSDPNYSCIQGLVPGGIGNIHMHPLFVNPDGPDNDPKTYEDNDYRLLEPSPCIDTGKNEDWMSQALDLDGNPRIVGERVDMGAYEWRSKVTGIKMLAAGEFQLTWFSRFEATYTVWSWSEPYGGRMWIEEATVSSAGERTTWTDLNPTSTRKFYRIQIW